MIDKATDLDDELRRILLEFPPDGQDFASFISCAIETVLGRRVWGARAGSQFGADMGTAESDGPMIRVEAKRYNRDSKLQRRELLGEIAEASDSCPSLDLWILATCAEVPEQIRAVLKREGDRRGIGIEILDLSPSLHCKLPRLLVETRATIVPFIRQSLGEAAAKKLTSLLRRYDRILPGNQKPLLDPACLFDLAAERARDFLKDAGTHSVVAGSRFGQRLPDGTFVARSKALASLDHWRATEDVPSSLFVVCGEEGDGKTWAATSWVANFADQHKSLPVFLSSRDASAIGSIEEGVSAFIQSLFPETNEAHWRIRVQRWLTTPGISSRLLVVLDGLNEQPNAPWRSLIYTLFAPDVQPASISSDSHRSRAKLPMIATCRTGFWKNHFPAVQEWQVELFELDPFSTPELRTFLRVHGRNPEDFSPEVWKLLKKPRYSKLVVQHYERLLESSDITIDRLLYEDWKHRWEQKRDFPLDDSAFQRLLGDLADQSLQGRHTHRVHELRQFLPADDDQRILTELVTGGVLEETSVGYKVVSARLYHALGLLLLNDLTQVTEEVTMVERLGTYLEPSGLDAHAAILTAAIFGASLTNAPPRVIRLLFRNLFSLQNLDTEVWRRVQAYFPAFPETYREFAEELVEGSGLDHNAFQAISSAYYRWCDHQKFSELVARHAERWLATIPLHSPWGDRDQHDYEQRLAQLFGTPAQEGHLTTEGVGFRLVSSPHFDRLHALAFGVLSARSTTVNPKALARWAVVSTVRRHSLPSASWIVRFLDTATTARLVEEIDAMVAIENFIWQEAAFNLASLLPDGRADDLQRRSAFLPPPSIFETWNAEDPCKTGVFLWRPSDCHACLLRLDIDARAKAANLAHHASDPTFRLPRGSAQRIRGELRHLLAEIDPAELAGLEFTRTRHDLERWIPAFARWIPRELARALRQHCEFSSRLPTLQVEADERVERRQPWSYELENIAMILGRGDSLRLRRFWEHWARRPPENRAKNVEGNIDIIEANLFRILLSSANPDEQMDLVTLRATTAFNDRRLIDVLPLGLAPDQLRCLWDRLFLDLDHLVAKLFLLSLDTVTLTTEQREQLVQIALDDARTESAVHVRIQALLSCDQELVRMLLDAQAGLQFELVSELYWIASAAIPRDTPLARLEAISPPFMSHILENRPDPEDDRAFALKLREFAASEENTHHWRSTARSSCPFSLPTVRRALAVDPSLGDDLIVRLDSLASVQPLENTYWLYHALCESLLESSSEAAQKLLKRLVVDSCSGGKNDVTRPHSVLALMARHQQHPAVPPNLKFYLNQCVTDAALQSYSLSFLPHQDTWLWDRIADDLTSDRPIIIARALTLAGFAHESERATQVLRAQAPRTGGWLDRVRLTALAQAVRDKRARHWFEAFLSRNGIAESWAAFQLFLTCVDRRFDDWLWPTIQSHGYDYRDTTRKMRHLRLNHQGVEKRIDEGEKHLKKRFCHSQIADGVFPWRTDWKLTPAQIEGLVTAKTFSQSRRNLDEQPDNLTEQ